MLEANKDKFFVGPGIGWLVNTSRNAGPWGIKPDAQLGIQYARELEIAVECMRKMHRRGIRVLPGGDYGFAWTPHGTNAKDLEYFVDMIGITPMEALLAATKHGGEIMGRPNELGQVKPGYLADLLLVDGDPLGQYPHPAGPQAHPRRHEGRHLPPGAGDVGPARSASPSERDTCTGGLRARRSMRLFLLTIMNGVTLAALYFLVASGFTLVFGLMRNVNLAHGSLYLLGAYIGYDVGDLTGSWFARRGRRIPLLAAVGLAAADRHLPLHGGPGAAPDPGHDRHLDRARRPDAGDLGRRDLSVRAAGLALRRHPLPLVRAYPDLSPGAAGHRHRHRHRALAVPQPHARRHDDPRRRRRPRPCSPASGVNVQRVFAITFAIGAGLAGFAGVVGGTALSIAPGEDTRYLLASLVVVIVGGMGSVTGAAIGALLIGLAEQFGLAYAPTYGVVFTFLIMVAVLAFRPAGHHGPAGMSATAAAQSRARSPRWCAWG